LAEDGVGVITTVQGRERKLEDWAVRSLDRPFFRLETLLHANESQDCGARHYADLAVSGKGNAMLDTPDERAAFTKMRNIAPINAGAPVAARAAAA